MTKVVWRGSQYSLEDVIEVAFKSSNTSNREAFVEGYMAAFNATSVLLSNDESYEKDYDDEDAISLWESYQEGDSNG